LDVILSGVEGLSEVEGAQADTVKREQGVTQTDLADVLTDLGQYGPAREAYQAALAIDEEVGDLRGAAVDMSQFGTLAMLEGDLAEAERRYKDALATFQRLNEPGAEATVWHQLGVVYQEARQWEPAEAAYRESARIKEAQGDLAGAARTWNQLAIVTKNAGKAAAAEAWYRKALEADRKMGNPKEIAPDLSNLADLLQQSPSPDLSHRGRGTDRLDEARQLAEEALAIDKTLDPGAAEIWKDYTILAEIADQQGRAAEAQDYRRQARAARAAFAGTQHQLQKHQNLIMAVVQAVSDAEVRGQLEAGLDKMAQHGWTNLVAAIRRVLAGERDEDALCDGLDSEDSMILLAILAGLAREE
jgi:tetratricopeptide (TPR) repeat protein